MIWYNDLIKTTQQTDNGKEVHEPYALANAAYKKSHVWLCSNDSNNGTQIVAWLAVFGTNYGVLLDTQWQDKIHKLGFMNSMDWRHEDSSNRR